jgi:uncharacterized lipoprotein YddW (UPF0748 family)
MNIGSYISPNHISKVRPQWFLKYGDKLYFNPGIPEVWTYLQHVVGDVVRRYDIDAVHFDDYFYPYRIPGKAFPDSRTYHEYGEGMSLDEWRRHNVDTVIQMLNRTIKEAKPWVKFGISPFGVWRNRDRDPEGSPTGAGQTNYDDLYADVLLWLKKGWIDYVAPQLYWEFGHRTVAYEVLLDWWAHHTYGRQLYIGQALYRVGSSNAWRNPSELPDQIAANRTYPQVKGSIYFSASVFYKDPLGFEDSLRSHYYKYPALIPRMPWIDSIAPLAPVITDVREIPQGRGLQLSWKDGDTSRQTAHYVLYRFAGDTVGDLNDPRHILSIVNKDPVPDTAHVQICIDRGYRHGQSYTYILTALDRLHNESLLSQVVHVTNKEGGVNIEY